jgi:hypothetical protein
VRRGLASLILGLSLLVASVAWSGFVLLHTVLDPGRSERLADEMLDNTVLRSALVGAMADSIEAGVPGGVELPRDQVEAAAGIALDDPRVEAVVRDGLVRIHQNALNGVDEPVVIDPSAFGASARDALVGARPELDQVLPAVPPAAISLPDTGLSFLGDVRDYLQRTVYLASLGALAGAAAALVITRDRPGVLRRVALWAFAAAAFWLILGYGVPWLAGRVMPGSAAVFAAAVEVFLGAMILPALVLAGAGLALLLVSVLWDAVGSGTRRSRAGHRERLPAPAHQPSMVPTGPPPPAAWSPSPAGGGHGPWDGGARPAPATRFPGPADQTRVQPGPAGPWAQPPVADPWDRTRVGASAPAASDPWDRTLFDGPVQWTPPAADVDPSTPSTPSGPAAGTGRHAAGDAGTGDHDGLRRGHGPRWVEGVGYVDE